MSEKSDIKINIPKNVATVLSLLESSGFEAYIVGGCVRDSLLNKEPQDYDITTNARPEQVKQIFHKTIDTGIEHGTITVRIGGESFEVTTYRIDGKYSDGRHPDSVLFTPNLKDDLMRRDFTINAMAYSKKAGLIDYYGGLSDLQNKIIRCVRDPILRFTEDALRMVRAIRFSATLGFEIENETFKAIKKLAENLKLVSKERIQVELIKLLESDNPEKFQLFDDTGLIENIVKEYTKYDEKEKRLVLDALKKSSQDIEIRLALVLGFIKSKQKTIDDINKELKVKAKQILRDLKFDNKTTNDVSLIIAARDLKLTTDEVQIRLQVNKISKRLYSNYLEFRKLINVSDKNDICKQQEVYNMIQKRKDATSVKELTITGQDLMNIGFNEGKDLGNALQYLLLKVIEDPTKNNKESLIRLAKDDLIS